MNRSFPFVLLPKRVVYVDNDGRMLDILRMRSLLRDVDRADRQGDNMQAEGERPGCKQALHLVSTASLSPFHVQTLSAAPTATWLPGGTRRNHQGGRELRPRE